MKKISMKARRKARQLALQAIYQWQLTAAPAKEIEQQFQEDDKLKKADAEYFQELVHGVPQEILILDNKMSEFLNRPVEELSPVELAVLRIATYELLHRLEIPYRVIINEALELTKTYGSVDGFKYVNGVLDRVAKLLRAQEFKIASQDS